MIALYHEDAWTEADAYVDSGAWYSVFKSEIAERLGLNLKEGTRVWSYGLNGQPVPIYLHRVGLRVAGFRISATVGFSDQLGIGFNLLGRHSIFDVLQFCFNDRDGELVVSRI
jgi:predicted aspartyl protease